MDRELAQMQAVADAFSGARLFRRSPPSAQNDAPLLLGLMLVLLTDKGADLLSVLALLYILM